VRDQRLILTISLSERSKVDTDNIT
jgi:hypothetical protein